MPGIADDFAGLFGTGAGTGNQLADFLGTAG
jgi:hypothetical protein